MVLAGVDGCRGGWVAAVETSDGALSLASFAGLRELLAGLAADAIVAVDMPIGLPERITGAGRTAEQAARAALGARRSSIFAMPARAAVEAGTGPFPDAEARRAAYRDACRLARLLSDPPRAPSIQAFGLFNKVMEIDRTLREDPALEPRVRESHPELAFAVLNGGVPMEWPKRRAEGLAERRTLLRRLGLPEALLAQPLPRGVGEDDRLDACVLLLVARRLRAGTAQSFPSVPERDRFHHRIAIHA